MSNSRPSQVFRAVLFAAGFGITMLVLALLVPFYPSFAAASFTIVNLLVLYSLIFAPMLLDELMPRLTGGRIVSLGIYATALVLYGLLTVFLVFQANAQPFPPMRLLFIVQLVALFVLMFALYVSGETAEHIDTVDQMSQSERSSIEWLRSLSGQLVLSTSRLDGSSIPRIAELASLAESMADDLRYLSPLNSPQAASIESSIATNLDAMNRLMSASSDDISPQTLDQAYGLALQTKDLIAQRKSMLN